MADEEIIQTPKFTIRRLSPGRDEAEPVSQRPLAPPKPKPSPDNLPSEAKQAGMAGLKETQKQPKHKPSAKALTDAKTQTPAPYPNHTAGLFPSARTALAFVGAAFNAGKQTGEAAVRRSPQNAWWAEVNAPADRVAQLVFAAGGTPHAPIGRGWVPLTAAGTVPDTQRDTLNVSDWPILDLGSLLAHTALRPGRYRGAPALDVFIPGPLARWAIRRAAALGIEARIAQASFRPLGTPDATPVSRLHIRLQAPGEKFVPAAFVHSLGSLPYVAVCRSGDEQYGYGQLLLDVRSRLPLPAPLLQAMVPQGEIWVLGPSDVGHWRVTLDGASVEASSLFDMTETAPVYPNDGSSPVTLPAPIPVRIVAKRGLHRRVDAVLVDDEELDWLRRFLLGRPVFELAFILPGNKRHLLTAPGGLPEAIPFGTPLAWIGPGPIYLELGTDFEPPLPEAARQARFLPEGNAIVGILRSGVWSFDPDNLLPVWSLWVGAAPPVAAGLSPAATAILAHIDKQLGARDTYRLAPGLEHTFPLKDSDRTRLIRSAQKAELRGDLVQAAELLEKAGLFGPAGRLYERVANGRG